MVLLGKIDCEAESESVYIQCMCKNKALCVDACELYIMRMLL